MSYLILIMQIAICFYLHLILQEVKKPSDKTELSEEPEPFVTRTSPEFTNPNMAGQDDSAIVIPKSPQLIEFEESEALRKMNL